MFVFRSFLLVLSKKLRVWERQLMKDFHVGIVMKKDRADSCCSEEDASSNSNGNGNGDGDGNGREKITESSENRNQRFRSIAKKAAMQTPTNKWRQTVDQVYKL